MLPAGGGEHSCLLGGGPLFDFPGYLLHSLCLLSVIYLGTSCFG